MIIKKKEIIEEKIIIDNWEIFLKNDNWEIIQWLSFPLQEEYLKIKSQWREFAEILQDFLNVQKQLNKNKVILISEAEPLWETHLFLIRNRFGLYAVKNSAFWNLFAIFTFKEWDLFVENLTCLYWNKNIKKITLQTEDLLEIYENIIKYKFSPWFTLLKKSQEEKFNILTSFQKDSSLKPTEKNKILFHQVTNTIYIEKSCTLLSHIKGYMSYGTSFRRFVSLLEKFSVEWKNFEKVVEVEKYYGFNNIMDWVYMLKLEDWTKVDIINSPLFQKFVLICLTSKKKEFVLPRHFFWQERVDLPHIVIDNSILLKLTKNIDKDLREKFNLIIKSQTLSFEEWENSKILNVWDWDLLIVDKNKYWLFNFIKELREQETKEDEFKLAIAFDIYLN